MPVTVTSPSPGDAVGPGTRVQASSSLGVLPAGAYWDAQVFTHGSSDRELISSIDFENFTSMELVLGRHVAETGTTPIFQTQDPFPAVGAEHDLVVRVISASSTILDTSGPIGVVWRPDPWGTAYIQSLSSPISGEAGFTESDRSTLETTNASVLAGFPLTLALGGIASVALGLLPRVPPIDFLSEGETIILSGRGSITRTQGSTGVSAYGGRWEVISKPAGLGLHDGALLRYEQRIIQLVVIKNRLGGGLYASEQVDAYYDAGEMNWGVPFPVRIDYYVLPGVSVRWRWLLFTGPPVTPP